ncbi:hypothetical protein EDD85DRAFT_826688 [Armillaria nabsnona]|nr:hypothetical protein EDD85DRAFT_826688 [Armillaria nabsnona]
MYPLWFSSPCFATWFLGGTGDETMESDERKKQSTDVICSSIHQWLGSDSIDNYLQQVPKERCPEWCRISTEA